MTIINLNQLNAPYCNRYNSEIGEDVPIVKQNFLELISTTSSNYSESYAVVRLSLILLRVEQINSV